MKSIRLLVFAIALIAIVGGCSGQRVVRHIGPVSDIWNVSSSDSLLKVHFNDGGLAVMSSWHADAVRRMIFGKMVRYDFNRGIIRSGFDSARFDDVALVESNRVISPDALAGMAVLSTASLVMTGFCIANPKACFGSCPTFYAYDGQRMSLQAEGFSSSIAPVLRATDLDALYNFKPSGDLVEILMTNEALETHVVDHVELVALKRPSGGGRVVATGDGEFVEAFGFQSPSNAEASEGDIRALVASYDERERFSSASAIDLAEREEVDFEFDSTRNGSDGLVIGFRESLMTTYLFYQGLAYLGSNAGAWLASCQRDSVVARRTLSAMHSVLGGIDVSIADSNGKWSAVGTIDEAGPIATNLQMIRIPAHHSWPLRVRLRMSKGLWRLNYVALATLGRSVSPLRLQPRSVRHTDVDDTAAHADLIDPARSLVTMPGDHFMIDFDLPNASQYEVFLESRGYYLEWMRTEWLAEEDPIKAAAMFAMPVAFLKIEASRFKLLESSMEQEFWSSRYAQP